MEQKPRTIKFDKVVIDCLDPQALSDFYARLLGWEKGYDTDDFVIIGAAQSNVDIGFQKDFNYVPPTWPEIEGKQRQMLHLDFAVDHAELEHWVQYAVSCGAKVAKEQYSDQWTVLLDPEGHPFCIDSM